MEFRNHVAVDIFVQMGFTTISMFCLPIVIRGSVIGVVEMVNKIGEDAFFDKVTIVECNG